MFQFRAMTPAGCHPPFPRHLRHRITTLACSVATAVVSQLTHTQLPAVEQAERPNVIVIMTDDQGSTDAGCYGAGDLVTPAIDALARRGVRFTQFYSAAPVCSLSRSETLPSVAAQRRMEPARLSRLVRGELDWIVMKALEKDRNRRYETADGFARDVEHFLDGDPVEASPPSAAYRLKKLIRKHGFAIGTAVTFVAVLLAATAVSTWQAIRAGRAEESALDEKSKADNARAAAEKDRKIADKARAAEATLRKAAEINFVRLQVEPLLELAFGCWLEDFVQGDDASSRMAAAILNLARFLREIPESAYAWREAATLCILDYGQHLVPLLPEPTFNGMDLASTRLSHDGRFFIGELSDSRIEVYSFPDFKYLRTLASGQPVQHLDVHGACMVSAMPRDRLRLVIWSLDDPASAGALIPSDRPIWDVLLSADGRRCVTLEGVEKRTPTGQIEYREPRARVWDIVDNNQATQRGELHGDATPVYPGQIILSPDGKWLVTKVDNRVMIFATDDLRLTRTFTLPDIQHEGFQFSPSGRFFAIAQGQEIAWWRTETWERIEPVCRSSQSTVNQIVFLSDDFLTVVTDSMPICFRRGEARGQEWLYPDAVVDDLLLTSEGKVWRWGSRKPLPKPGDRKFAPEAAKFAISGRYLQIYYELVDLETGVVVCRADPVTGLGLVPVEKDGLAWVTHDNQWLHFPQEPGKLDPRTVELWLQVILRGELNDDDEFAPWDEATWQSHRRELAQRQVRLGQFSFPGVMADDRLYWLRREAKAAVDVATAGGDEQRALELTDRLMREEPTWRSHDLRATLCTAWQRYAGSIRERLESARMRRPTDWISAWIQSSKDDVFKLVQQKDRPAAEYELLLRWLDESQRVPVAGIPGAVLRSLALYRLGRHREAIEYLEGIQKSTPRESAAQNAVRALCLLALGETKAAQDAFRAALPDFDRAKTKILFSDFSDAVLWSLDLTDDLLPVLPVLTGGGAEKEP